MVAAIVASLVLLGSAATVSATGSASVINACDYDVKVNNVPSYDGGFHSEIDTVLASGQTYTQQWTVLNNLQGWSIKLFKPDDPTPMQFEYTNSNDGMLWYDLSCVNGDPWKGDWDAESDNAECIPKHVAYMYSTDDVHGMQPGCSIDASITVTLCSSNNASSGASAAPQYSSVEAAAAPSSTSESSDGDWALGLNNVLQAANHVATGVLDAAPTTLATIASPVAPVAAVVTDAPAGNVVTQVDVVYATEVVTAIANSRVKRHQHHPHGHQHQA